MYQLVRDPAISRSAGVAAISAVVRRSLRWCAALAILPLLASCGGHDDHGSDHGGGPGGGGGSGGSAAVAQQGTLGLVAADFLNNGQTQILGTSTIAQAQSGTGQLQFFFPATAPATTFADGNDPLYLAAADLNGDGLPDVVSASGVDGTLNVFMNTTATPGTFALPITLQSQGASQVAILDMNGDGVPDLVSADFNVSLFIQTSPGAFAAPIALSPGSTASSSTQEPSGGANWVALGDLNGDGLPDVALTDNTGLKVVMNATAGGTTSFAAPVSVYTFATAGQFQVVALADVNGDGLGDLIVTDQTTANHTVEVLLQDASNKGTFLAPVAYDIQPADAVSSILVADVNGDGLPDILVGGAGGVSVLLQNPATAGTFQTAAIYNAPFANQIALADVDGDGRVDIVVGSGPVTNLVQANTPGVLLQSATAPGTFGALQALPGPAAAATPAAPAPGM